MYITINLEDVLFSTLKNWTRGPQNSKFCFSQVDKGQILYFLVMSVSVEQSENNQTDSLTRILKRYYNLLQTVLMVHS